MTLTYSAIYAANGVQAAEVHPGVLLWSNGQVGLKRVAPRLSPGDLRQLTPGPVQLSAIDVLVAELTPRVRRKSLGLKYSDDEARDDHGRWTDGGGGDTGPSPADLAATVHAAAVAAEPKITEAMQAAAGAHGGKLVGLDFRVKTPGSLERKIAADAKAEGITPTEAAAAVSDANRYTMELSEEDYTKGAEATLDDLKSQGYSERVKNFWPDGDPYQGINAALKTPEGQNVELQFHTATSFDIKETVNHPLYESFRTSTDQGARRSLWDRMVANARSIPVPPGVLSIPTLRVQKL